MKTTVAHLVARRSTCVVLLGAVVFGSSLAVADATTDGTYASKFEEVSNNCTNVGLSLSKATLIASSTATEVVVQIDGISEMRGAAGKAGRIKVASAVARTSLQGLDGKFSLSARKEGEGLQGVLVAEYLSKGKPLCMQSWNVVATK